MNVDRTCNRDWKERRNGYRLRYFLFKENFPPEEREPFMSRTGWVWPKISAALAKKFNLPRKACDAIMIPE